MDKEVFERGLFLLFSHSTAIIIGIFIGYYLIDKQEPVKDNNTLPVEEIIDTTPIEQKVDTLRDTINKIRIIKTYEIQKVQTLNADSTVKLFKELLSE